jgi:hypothetical protein
VKSRYLPGSPHEQGQQPEEKHWGNAMEATLDLREMKAIWED